MFFVLYDKDLKSIGETYVLESWSRKQRANDFDEITIVGEQIPYSANPYLVVVNDKQGRQMFSGLASTPIIDEKLKKTTIVLKDYLTLLNSYIIIDWSLFKLKRASTLITLIFSTWQEQIDVGLQNINVEAFELFNIILDNDFYNFTGLENKLAYSLISDVINYYDIYCEAKLNIEQKQLTFTFKKVAQNNIEIKLEDFGIYSIEKSFGDYNRATVYNTALTSKVQEWALAEDNTVVKLPTEKKLVYPAKNCNFIIKETSNNLTSTQATNNAIYDAVMCLANNRYQESIDLNVQQYKSIIDLTNIDFSYKIKVYLPDNNIINLPVGEIETDSKGKYIIKLGHRVQELTQEI